MTIPPSLVDLTIGKYQILELAGEGAMGAVYRARDAVLNRTVAIKVMNATIARDDELRDRFLREAQSAGSLQHPNVVTIFDFGEVDGHLFIAMEFVEGTDLEQLLARPEPPSLETKLEIMIDALAGLAYAHSRGIVHRDLKPANIRVTPEPRAKLMDFGVAHLESSKLTKTGMMIGTPHYMAPEYISGKPVTAQSDIFSMGAVLYEVLTGRRPFEGETMHAVLFSVVQSDPPLPSSIVPTISSALDAIVRRAMAKNPEDRFQTALEMAHALTTLRAAMRGLPASAMQSLSTSLSTTLAHRVAARGGAAARDAAARTGGASLPPTAASVAAADIVSSDAPSASRTRALAIGGIAVVALLGATVVFVRTGRSSPGTPIAAASTSSTVADSANAGRESIAAASSDGSPAKPAAVPTAPVEERAASAAPTVIAGKSSGNPESSKSATATVSPAVATSAKSASAPPSRPNAPSMANTTTPTSSPAALVAAPAVSPSAAASAPPATSVVVPSPPTVAPSVAVAADAASARSVQGELRDLITRYAQGISARDINAIRATYPRLTGDQQRGFEQFFASTKDLHATLTLGNVDITDATADGRVSGVYEFVSSSGRSEKQSVTFRASFERQGDRWRIAAVR